MWKLGTMVKDKVTGMRGMLTHLMSEGDNRIYLFQPHGLDPETGEPIRSIWIDPDRVLNGQEVRDTYLALEVLGTEVEDEASGFKGTAVATYLHINGCLHIDVQPAGTTKNGGIIKRQDFDIRRMRGKAIKFLSESDLDESKQRTPSPAPFTRPRE